MPSLDAPITPRPAIGYTATKSGGAMQSAENTRLFYVILGDKWSTTGDVQSKALPGCKCSVHEGVMAAHCITSDQLAQLVLSLIELGVSPLAPAAWLCGPAGELAQLILLEPSPCPDMATDRATLLCRTYTVCLQAYKELLNSGHPIVGTSIRKQGGCFNVHIHFSHTVLLKRLLEIVTKPERASQLILLNPKILPPLNWESGNKTWLHGCSLSRARNSYKTSKSR